MSAEKIKAVIDLAAATREQANATRAFVELHDRLWLSLKPSARAKILGVSRNTEAARRKKAELIRLAS